ncbi:MAG: RNA polymerase sigma factor [Actinomycetota bacterium]|jgi:RNA polymerase sigma-70 factor (ECF subfamily)|nr:RNA polymerase sigma factor [Actinomycetota bacterium]
MASGTEERSDAWLVRAAHDGDLGAFGVLVRRHQDRVYRVCLRMLGDVPEAEDATQDVLVRAWRSLDRYRGDAALSTWLYRLTLNRCIDLIRGRRQLEDLSDDLADPGDQPDELVEASQLSQVLGEAVQALTFEQRAAFVLRYSEGRSYREIAGVLGVSEAAVKSRLNRARTELMKAMGAWV